MDWQTIELRGYAHYSAEGYRILVPLVRHNGYDFVAEKEGHFLRVNVKVAGLKDKTDSRSWAVSQASGSAGYGIPPLCTDIDIYLVWLPTEERFIELPGDFFAQGNSKHRRIPRMALR